LQGSRRFRVAHHSELPSLPSFQACCLISRRRCGHSHAKRPAKRLAKRLPKSRLPRTAAPPIHGVEVAACLREYMYNRFVATDASRPATTMIRIPSAPLFFLLLHLSPLAPFAFHLSPHHSLCQIRTVRVPRVVSVLIRCASKLALVHTVIDIPPYGVWSRGVECLALEGQTYSSPWR